MTRRGVSRYGDAERDRMMLQFAAGYVRAHPGRALWLKLRNLGYIFQPRLLPFFDRQGIATVVDGRLQIPEQRRRPVLFEAAAAAFQAMLLGGGLTGLIIRRARLGEDAFLLVVAGSIIAVNAIFFPTSRLLAPMSFVWMFYAAVALVRLKPDAAATSDNRPTGSSAGAPRRR